MQESKFMANISFLENEVIEFQKTTGENKNIQKRHMKRHKKILKKSSRILSQEITAKEIAEYCGYKGIDSFKGNYLKLLLEQEKIKMTILDKPKKIYEQ